VVAEVNCLAPAALALALLPGLQAAAATRAAAVVVNVASSAHVRASVAALVQPHGREAFGARLRAALAPSGQAALDGDTDRAQ
jgi:hypothetical protein